MWVYHNTTKEDKLARKLLCGIACGYPHVKLFSMAANLATRERRLNPRLWRFLPLLDGKSIDLFVSRDVDTPILPREVAAVKEWINSPYSYHVMRDHPQHGVPILAGEELTTNNTNNHHNEKNIFDKVCGGPKFLNILQ